MNRMLIVSRYFPPSADGTSTVYENLLHYFDQQKLFVISCNPRFRNSGSDLTCRVYRCLPVLLTRTRLGKYFLLLYIPIIVFVGIVVCKLHKIDRILGTYPDPSFFISSYLIHKLTGIPFYIYLHDTFLGSQNDPLLFKAASLFKERIFRSAKKIFVISEGMYEYYKEKYNIQTVQIPHCLNEDYVIKSYNVKHNKNWTGNRIVFTGSIYGMNLDAIKLMVETINRMVNTKFCISTPSIKALRKLSVSGENIEATFIKDSDSVFDFQRRSDILYLPLAFNRSSSEEIKTVFPTKTIEYLISGVPILVHAPDNYFLTRFAKREGVGLIVDQYNSIILENSIKRLLEDKDLREKMVEKAFRTAIKFDGKRISDYMKKNLFEN